MSYYWQFTYETANDIVVHVGGTQYNTVVTNMPTATSGAYTLSAVNHLDTELQSITEQTQMELRRPNNTTYIALPVRRPK